MDKELFAQVEDAPAVISQEDRLLEKVLDSGNIEVLERYIALRKSEEERQARITFEEHFASMQAKLPAVAKAKDNNGTKSKYAPIEDLQTAWDPIIRGAGFSYSWREEALPEGKRVWLDIVGFGHTKSNYFDAPQMTGNSAQNAIQIAGAMSTYGRRYTFIAGIGGKVEGEDADGQISEDADILEMDLRAYIDSGKLSPQAVSMITKELVSETKNVDKLKAYYKRARVIVEGRK